MALALLSRRLASVGGAVRVPVCRLSGKAHPPPKASSRAAVAEAPKAAAAAAAAAHSAASYKFHMPMTTRWNDNDMYNHVNNVEYLAMFDSVINTYLIRHGGTRPHADVVTGWCVESRCKYYAPVSFPQPVLAGLRVSKIGRSSVVYEVGIFGVRGDASTQDISTLHAAAAHDLYLSASGAFVHVFVKDGKSFEIPARLRDALGALLVTPRPGNDAL